MAGMVAGKTNNNIGVSGIAGGNNEEGTKLLSYVLGSLSSDYDDAIIAAVDNGAKIIQIATRINMSDDIEDAIQYAINHNVLIVAAAGNDSPPQVVYPASSPYVIGVGSSDQNNHRTNNTHYGIELDITAPGIDIYYARSSSNIYSDYGIWHLGSTSLASAMISGVAALVLSANIDLTGLQVRNILERTAQKVGGYDYQITSGRPNGAWHEEMGYGVVNAYDAVVMAQVYMDSITGPDTIDLCEAYTYQFPATLPSEEYSLRWRVSENMAIRSGQYTDAVEVEMVAYPLGESGYVYVDVMRLGVAIYTLSKSLDYSGLIAPASNPNLSTEDFTLSANTMWSGSKILGVEATVASGATLTITGTVSCTDKAQIIIQPGGKLVIDGGTLTAACPDSLWQGIVVLGDASKQNFRNIKEASS